MFGPLILAGSLGTRQPTVAPLRPPVPIVRVEVGRRDDATGRLAATVDPTPLLRDRSGSEAPPAVTVVRTEATSTGTSAWNRSAFTLFSELR